MVSYNNPDWFVLSAQELQNQDLICSICSNVFNDPVQTANDSLDPCGHIFCKSCIMKWLEKNQTCPNCSSSLTSKQLLIDGWLRRKIHAFQVVCHIDSELCTETGKLGKKQKWWNEHDKICKYKCVECLLCQKKMEQYKIKKHMRNECQNFFTQCTVGCGKPIQRKRMSTHVHKCSFRKVECSQCLTIERHKKIAYHIENECPKSKINCIYSSIGCKYSHFRDDKKGLENHMEKNIATHLDLATNALQEVGKIPNKNKKRKISGKEEEVLQLCKVFYPKNPQTVIVSQILAQGFGGDWRITYGDSRASEDDIPLFIINCHRIPVRVKFTISLLNPITGNPLDTFSAIQNSNWQTGGSGWISVFHRSRYPILQKINFLLVSATVKLHNPDLYH